MEVRHILFDLDGTLIHSLPGIEASARAAVEAITPERSLPPLKPLIGPPLPIMLSRALGVLGEDVLARLVAAFREHYDTVGWRESILYHGAKDVLKSLIQSGATCYLVTNKRHAPALTILGHLGLLSFFQEVVAPRGHGNEYPAKPAATADLVRRRAIPAESTLFVGDSEDDARAARTCGLRFAAALYGYGNPLAEGDHEQTLRLNALNELPGHLAAIC